MGRGVGTQPNIALERSLWAQGYVSIAGIDEVGRGAWAGPVVAAAVCLPATGPDLLERLRGVRDSKLLSPSQREACFALVIEHCVSPGVGVVPSEEVDRMGVLNATRKAMLSAVADLSSAPEYLLIDYVRLPQIATPQHSLPKGDRYCLSIAAASIVAKVTRDRLMVALDASLPGYGFAAHKGYGTRQHAEALRLLGSSPQHRHTFAPVRACDEERAWTH